MVGIQGISRNLRRLALEHANSSLGYRFPTELATAPIAVEIPQRRHPTRTNPRLPIRHPPLGFDRGPPWPYVG
jgi:hypothetical protein